MTSILASFLCLCTAAVPGPTHGVLYQPAFSQDDTLRGPARPYRPQMGDIFLSTDHLRIVQMGHKISGADGIHHSGLILVRRDGSAATLEAAPHNTLTIKILDMEANLRGYLDEGSKVWIRRRMTPLTPRQCENLLNFAETQNGKPFALGRVFAQMTPFRSRGPVRTNYLGKPNGDRFAYYCAELAMETLLAAEVLDPNRTRPSATYPVDIFYGRSDIPFIDQNLDINKGWEAPARWESGTRVKK